MTGFLNGIIQLPIINITDSGVDFVCPGTGPTSSLREYTSFFSQVGTFIPIAGLLFTIAVYGAKSVFGIMTTCLIDDIVIATTSFAPIFWWYTFAKPLWFYGVTNQIQDTNQNYGLIYSIILCILFGTMIIVQTIAAIIRFHFHQRRNKLDEVSLWFRMAPNGVIECTYKHGEDEKVFAEIKVRNINEVVHFYKMDETQDKWIRCRFGSAGGYFYICEEKEDEGKSGVFESEPILKEIMEITETEENCILKHRNCERIKEVMKKNLKDEKRKTLEAEGENVTNTNIIDVEKATETKMKTIKVKKMKAEDKVLINILETGALNYFIYSHRKDYKGNKENDKPKVPKVKYVFDINKVHKKC
ncbi:7516_t:CDS:2 [Entrophospora sp. SA101]|nr:7516_t:CDS:2 [Entrophospora sp. SA101]